MLNLKIFGVDERILAHTSKGVPSETLIEHSNLTLEYLQKIIDDKKLDELIDNLILTIDEEYKILIKEMFVGAIYLHDLGKKNPYFQAHKMDNNLFEAYQNASGSSEHSYGSSTQYLEYYKEIISKVEMRVKRDKLKFILYGFSYAISKHHGKLSLFEDYREEELVSSFRHLKKFKIEPFNFYILNKLLFSLLVSSDYYATTAYMAGLATTHFGSITDDKKQKIIDAFENDKIIKAIRANEVKGINILRSQMFLEAEQNLLEHLDKHIFYLEAPTGSGKTLTSINLAMTFLKKDEQVNKIFYIFPFNTLVEQTRGVFEEIFKDTLNIEVINAITPIKETSDAEQEKVESDYQKSYMNRLFFHNELIISTHIAFFNILFGTSKEDNFPLWQLANSVIILDEIQSYDNNLWSYMTKFFAIYAKALNIKIIIMSATLPKLDELIEHDNTLFVDLINDRAKYFEDDYFKNRVEIDYSLLEHKSIAFDDLKEKLLEESSSYNKILFEFIKKQSARAFYTLIKEDEAFNDFEVHELSGDDNKAFRQKVINRTKADIKIIVIATQVIEAGVDIDMDLGFKDISILDSEEQFMGRVNRSCKKLHLNPKVYFFDRDEERKIYKKDNRLEFNLKNEKYREVLKSKDFTPFYDAVLNKLRRNDQNIEQGVLENFEAFEVFVQKLNYREIQDKMQLIKSQNFRLYFPFSLDIKDYDFEELKNIDEFKDEKGFLDGQKVWDEFVEMNSIEGYAKREIYRYKLNSLMQFFTFNIIKYSDKQVLPHYSEAFGGYYYIQDYEAFIDEDAKFDREAYLAKGESLFL
ncbi:MAG: CRISPR-associated helicase Cas3 [uncultured Sulfurovum sp.]|uniref:CRISPR-associated helicase Cas3 n=1 Tax=uncultured Sulfurovum sp. TaxID=269237 RepID=A0A6S6U8L4_9BACT|nr:MAG: CRISPR-associated helicase Cas3 [uncultured Sulfurovum sp.]